MTATLYRAEARAMAPQRMAERAVACSRADGCIAIAESASSVDLRWAGNRPTSNGASRATRLTIVSTIQGARGTAVGVIARSGATADALESLVRASEVSARASQPAADSQPLIGARAAAEDWDEPIAESTPASLSCLAPQLDTLLRRARLERRLTYGFVQHTTSTVFIASSTGLRLRHQQPSLSLELTVRSRDRAASTWSGIAGSDPATLDVPAIDEQLTGRLDRARRRFSLPARCYEVVLAPSAVADLMVPLYRSAGAQLAWDGQSVFSAAGGGTRVGERLTDAPLTLRSDPAARGLSCAPFLLAQGPGSSTSVFDTGLELPPTAWIQKGRLAALVQTRHSSGIAAMPLTPWVDNLILDGGVAARPFEDLVARVGRGLLVSSVWYVREVDPRTLTLTGVTRDGVFLIDHGEIVGAVNNFRFNESPVDLLARVVDVGVTERTLGRECGDGFPRTAMPPLRIADFRMSGVSEAI